MAAYVSRTSFRFPEPMPQAGLNVGRVAAPLPAHLLELLLQLFLLNAHPVPRSLRLLAYLLLRLANFTQLFGRRLLLNGHFHVRLNLGFEIVQALFLEHFAGVLTVGQSEVQILFFLFADHAHAYRAALTGMHGMSEVAGIVHRLVVDLHDDVAGTESGSFGAA